MQKDAAFPVREVRADGGAACNNLLMQFQADLLVLPVVCINFIKRTCLMQRHGARLETSLPKAFVQFNFIELWLFFRLDKFIKFL